MLDLVGCFSWRLDLMDTKQGQWRNRQGSREIESRKKSRVVQQHRMGVEHNDMDF